MMMAGKSGFWRDPTFQREAWGLLWKGAGWVLALWAMDRWVWVPIHSGPEWVQGLATLILAATVLVIWVIGKAEEGIAKRINGPGRLLTSAMNVRKGTCRLVIVLSVIYWLVATWHAVLVGGAEMSRTYTSIGGADASGAEALRLFHMAQEQANSAEALTIVVYGAGYLLLWIVFFAVRWIVRGYRSA